MPQLHPFAGSSHGPGGSAPAAAWLVWITLSLWFWYVPAPAEDASVKVYARGGRAANLTREQLRDILFVRQTKWLDGSPIRVFVLPDQHPLHMRFAKEILGVYPYQLRAAWDRMVYSGTGVPPAVVDNVEAMRQRVEETSGGIGYLAEE